MEAVHANKSLGGEGVEIKILKLMKTLNGQKQFPQYTGREKIGECR